MKFASIAIATSLLITNPALSGTELGSEAEAQLMATELSQIILMDGVEAGIAAMYDPNGPFSSSALGLHIFEGSMVVADNRMPDLKKTSYADVADLTWRPMWPRIVAAADTRTDAMLAWYHYEDETEYTYHCYSEWAQSNTVLVMACR